MKASLLIIATVVFSILFSSCSNSKASTAAKTVSEETYQCIPCGYDCDKKTFNKPGKCSECQMELVNSESVKHKSISPTALCSYLKENPDVIILDVRTKREFEGKGDPNYGSLRNAINIPVQELEKRMDELSAYKGKEIIVYCSHSHRSPRASYMLTSQGFSNVTNLEGGVSLLQDSSCKRLSSIK